MRINGLQGIGQVANIPGAISSGTAYKQQKEDRDEELRVANTTWLAGAAKYGLDNWGQPGILEQLVEEGKRKGVLDAQTDPSQITREGLIKIYNGAKTALGGERFQDVDSLPIGQRDTWTGKVTSGGGAASQPKPPASITEYRLAVQQGYPGTFLEFQNEVNASRAGGRAQGDVDVTGTPGQQAVDRAYASDYVEWTQGGASDVVRNIAQLKNVQQRLLAGEQLTGGLSGITPGPIRAYTNPGAQDALEQVEEVVQRNLRIILGAQFTEKEGERLIARAYNPRLSPEQNAPRLAMLITMMEQAAAQKTAAAKYYDANGSLRGWQGVLPTVQDFGRALDELDAQMGGGQQDAPSGAPQIGDVRKGYVYIGGPPNQPSSWQKVRE